MEKRNLIFIGIFLIGLVLIITGFSITGKVISSGDSYVERSFSLENLPLEEILEVTLVVNVNSEDQIYGIEETVPEGFTIINSTGGAISGRNLRWIVMDGIVEGIYAHSYNVQVSDIAGIHNFSGQFLFETQEDLEDILGDIQIESYAEGDCRFSSEGALCGETSCSQDICSGEGNNTYLDYPLNVNSECSQGACLEGSCSFIEIVCGNTKICSVFESSCLACTIGSANCNLKIEDACEINLLSDKTNCGACGVSCEEGDACSSGICQKEICLELDVSDHNTFESIAASILSYYSGEINLAEILRRAKIYTYCE
jgi:hypothetical protein